MPSEFEIIARYFARPTGHTELGVGDDAALVRLRPGMDLAISTDSLVAGTHFLPGTDPEALGWKTLAVNLSDMAAMGAEPRWAMLAAALPAADEAWIAAFARGFWACAECFGVDLIGGDTTRGPLNLTPTVLGETPQGKALKRSGALPDDDLWVSGSPGLAALGLAHLQGRCRVSEPHLTRCLSALERPQPRVQLGLALRDLAHAAIDVSDGLLADVGHILERSGVGARIDHSALPWHAVREACADEELAKACLLTGGDDYELAFCADLHDRAAIHSLSQALDLPLTRIGIIVSGQPGELALVGEDGSAGTPGRRGFDHFAR
jgi:thiamine-monophosphate kinase